jgi:hypothetical protein
MSGLDKLNVEDDDIVVGNPTINRPVSVAEIVNRAMTLHMLVEKYETLTDKNPSGANEELLAQAIYNYAEYINRLYVPLT